MPGLLAVLGAATALALSPGSALATGSRGYYVTFVARSCPSYDDVFANKARNDIQESLKDLGPDSPYNTVDTVVRPAIEGLPPQTACSPLPNWRFTLGHGYQSRADTGSWGSLSKVTDPFRHLIVTRASTPLYDQYHNRIGGLRIPGAVTIRLTRAERDQASNASQLWAQGGVPGDPVLDRKYPGTYGFAALRCAVDALNGDNVEYIFFPAGVTHVFCYAFYVVPPPTSGTITIEKHVVAAPGGQSPAFAFNGSISFDPNGFTLADGQSRDFFRAGGQTWDVTESAVDNYALTSVKCTAETATGAAGSSTATVTGATTAINLVADEHVTCVYTNTYQEPSGGLTVTKITRGGVGSFGYTVTPTGGGAERRAVATTQNPGVPAAARPSLTDLRPGDYTITERAPATDLGRWRTVRITCDGVREKPGKPAQVTVRSGETSACEFVNVFVPAGAISLAKITTGSTGTVQFLITPLRGSAQQYSQHATTTTEGVAADAIPNRASDATDHLRLGTYLIGEQAPPSEDADSWALQYVQCNGELVPFDRGFISVTLTAAHPGLHCVFTDHFTAQPPQPPEPPPTPPTPPSPPNPNTPTYAISNISVTKQALDPFAVQGEPVTFRVAVHNSGPDTAANVVLADKPASKATVVSARPSAGTCQIGKIVVCRLGSITAGDTVTVLVKMIPETSASPFVNRAVVGGATADASIANNIARSRIRVVVPPALPVACSSGVAPVARAAC